MSVIHEALKRDLEKQSKKLDFFKITASQTPWLWWVMLFFVAAEGGLFLRESALRKKAEKKLKLALLNLNDARGDSMDVKEDNAQVESEAEELKAKLKKSFMDQNEISAAKRAVEMENIKKEKKISELTTAAHQSEMRKYELQEEVQSLKKELAKSTLVATPAPVKKNY